MILGYYALGCVAMLAVFWELAGHGRSRARGLGNDVHRVFMMCGVLTLVVWLCYPIAWGVSEGGNVIAPDSEAVFYGVLDFLAKPVSLNHCTRARVVLTLGTSAFPLLLSTVIGALIPQEWVSAFGQVMRCQISKTLLARNTMEPLLARVITIKCLHTKAKLWVRQRLMTTLLLVTLFE